MITEADQGTLVLHEPGVQESLSSLREVVSQAQQEAYVTATAHAKKTTALYNAVQAYNDDRRASILRELAQRGLAYCTVCKKMQPQDGIQLVLSEGSYQESCGYEGGDYCTRAFSNLHNACAACRGKLKGSHGVFTKARYGDEFDSSYCYPVDLSMGEYWVTRSGQRSLVRKYKWAQAPKIPDTPPDVYEKLAAEWKFPPALKIEHDSNGMHSHEEVVFKERH